MSNVINLFPETMTKTEPAHAIRFFIKGTDTEVCVGLGMIQFNNYDTEDLQATEEEWAECAIESVFTDQLDDLGDHQSTVDALLEADLLEIRAERIHTDLRFTNEWFTATVV